MILVAEHVTVPGEQGMLIPQLIKRSNSEMANEPAAGTQSICLECKLVGVCKERRTRPQPIKECKNFVSYKSSPEILGLCVNCENRDTCKLRKPEGGVWHCEEYR